MISPDGDTEFYKTHAGVLHDDTPAPFLFIIALDYGMKKATRNPSETGFTILNHQGAVDIRHLLKPIPIMPMI